MQTNARWLHISDLHVFAEADTTFMLDDYKELAQVISPQFLIVTGDFRHKSRQTDFSLARRYLEAILDIFRIDKADVFLIPGNHDVNEYEGRSNSIIDICQHSENDDYDFYSHYPLNKGFSEYKNFVYEFYMDSNVRDSRARCPEEIMCVTWNDMLNIIMINTALVSDGKEHGEIVDINALSQCRIESDKPSIIIGHHSLESLYPCFEERIKGVIDRRKISAYLHGDGHRYSNKPISNIFTPNITIPGIACAKSAPQSGDQFSDIGIVYYEWQSDDNVYVQAYRWSPQGFREDPAYYYNINKQFSFPMIYKKESKPDKANVLYRQIKNITESNNYDLFIAGNWVEDAEKIWESTYEEEIGRCLLLFYSIMVKNGVEDAKIRVKEILCILEAKEDKDRKTQNMIESTKSLLCT